MIHLVDHEEQPDAEEERLRAHLYAQQKEHVQQEVQRRRRSEDEAHTAARQEAEAAEIAQTAKQMKRDLEARSAQESGPTYRIASEQGSPAKAPPSPSPAQRRRSLPSRNRVAPRDNSLLQFNRRRVETPDIGVAELTPDYFQPLQAQQPSMFEAMKLAPGVSMGESGRSKGGPQSTTVNRQMTRKEYLQLAANNNAGSTMSGPDASVSSTATPADEHVSKDFATEGAQWDQSLLSNSEKIAPYGVDNLLQQPLTPTSVSRSSGFGLPRALPPSQGPRPRQPAVGMRELFQRSLMKGTTGTRPAADAGNTQPSLGASVARNILAHGSVEKAMRLDFCEQLPASISGTPTCRGQSKRLSASKSGGSLAGGGTIIANRDLLKNLFANTQH